MSKRPSFADVTDLSEDERIQAIGNAGMRGLSVGFMTDVEGTDHSKGDRYIAKLAARFPQLVVLSRVDGPVPAVETIKMGFPPKPPSAS